MKPLKTLNAKISTINLVLYSIGLALFFLGIGLSEISIANFQFITNIGIGFLIGGLLNTIINCRYSMKTFIGKSNITTSIVLDCYIKLESSWDYESIHKTEYYTYFILAQFYANDKEYIIEAIVDKEFYGKTGKNKLLKLNYSLRNPHIFIFENEC